MNKKQRKRKKMQRLYRRIGVDAATLWKQVDELTELLNDLAINPKIKICAAEVAAALGGMKT